MASNPRVVVTGLREVSTALRNLGGEAQAELKTELKAIAEHVAADARARVPRRTGRAAASYRARGGVKGAGVAMGGARVPYVPWLDFGGSVGPRRSVKRSTPKGGRYLYPAIEANLEDVQDKVGEAIMRVARKNGLI